MSSKIFSAAVLGLDAELIEVEADTGGGELGSISIVGLPDAAVSESRERVRSAIKNSNLFFPRVKVTVNLAPADIKKQGPGFDLPIAVSVLAASGKLKSSYDLSEIMLVGELALSGNVRPVNGVLSMAVLAKKRGIKQMFVPKGNADEANLIGGIEVYPVLNLLEVVNHLTGINRMEPMKEAQADLSNDAIVFDMAHIRGQESVKRAMEISAAGAHNMMMSGPPGSGKTLIARTMPSILPDLTLEEALDVTKIYSVAGKLRSDESLVRSRPFRSPHHSSSAVALVGGGTWPRPGEISLSHRGVLFLDEFGEFPRSVLENLRQPLEDGVINISRAAGNLTFPAKFILISASNPCPCGYHGDMEKACVCTPTQVVSYKKKISGPILDRIDLHVEVPRVDYDKLTSDFVGESSVDIKKRVEKARKVQAKRFKGLPFITNSEMSSEKIKQICNITDSAKQILKKAVDQMHLSARSYFRVIKLAQTIADLDGSDCIDYKHTSEALQYRPAAD